MISESPILQGPLRLNPRVKPSSYKGGYTRAFAIYLPSLLMGCDSPKKHRRREAAAERKRSLLWARRFPTPPPYLPSYVKACWAYAQLRKPASEKLLHLTNVCMLSLESASMQEGPRFPINLNLFRWLSKWSPCMSCMVISQGCLFVVARIIVQTCPV